MRIKSNVLKLKIRYNKNVYQFHDGQYIIPDGEHAKMLKIFKAVPEGTAKLTMKGKVINKRGKEKKDASTNSRGRRKTKT